MEAYVLIVDDDPDCLEMISAYLAFRGLLSATATNGEEALATAFSRPPLLVLMDLSMPGAVDGLEAIRRLKADPRTKGTTVIAVTACVMAKDRIASTAAGADDFIPKPFDLAELGNIVARIMERRSNVRADVNTDAAGG
jgi:CheY-like chemotaxis protein